MKLPRLDILKVTFGGRAENENVKNDKPKFAISPPPTDATLKMSSHVYGAL